MRIKTNSKNKILTLSLPIGVCVCVCAQCFLFIIVCYTWKTNTRWWYYALVIFSALIHFEKREKKKTNEMWVCVNIFDGGYSTRNKHTKNSFAFTLFLCVVDYTYTRTYCCSFRRAFPFNLSYFFSACT